jgi:predicted regulator of Ras-like GTPase activity (Roadblock/LC7/MglB family)
MLDIVLTAATFEKIRDRIEGTLISAGVGSVLIVDSAGNVVINCGKDIPDSISLAALTAANFAATSQIAKMIGEEDFSLLFHKGKKDSVHFSKINQEFIMITIFGEEVSLGIIRLRVNELIKSLQEILGD